MIGNKTGIKELCFIKNIYQTLNFYYAGVHLFKFNPAII